MTDKPTPADVARWMVEQLEQQRYLYQEVAVYAIRDKFGEEFVYTNENGNPAVDRRVLAEFRKLTEKTVVWERGERVWRHRQNYDLPSRQAE